MSRAHLVLINATARSVPANARDTVQGIFSEFARGVDVRDCDFASSDLTLAQALDETEGLVTVWGGDGTICWALNTIASARPILALPGGTMNLVHKRIHGDILDPADLLRAALKNTLKTSTLRGGQANGHRFFVAAMLGHLTKLTEVRESVRKVEPVRAIKALVEGDLTDTEAHLSLHPSDVPASAIAAFLPDDEDARFEVGTINPETLADLMTAAMEAGFTDWRDAERVNYQRVAEPLIESDLASVPCALDGEPIDLQPPIKIKPLTQTYDILSARGLI